MAGSDPSHPVRAAVALGSNLGDRLGYLRDAVAAMSRFAEVVSLSPLYETAPIGGPDQAPYLNAVVVIETTVPAARLMELLHGLERAAGRTRDVRWGPRTLDLDLILYGDRRIDGEGLHVPHPRFRERRFVLEPLLAAWPEAAEPDGTPIAPLLDSVADQELREVRGRDWAEETPGSSGRGGTWVLAQFALLTIHAALAMTTSGSLWGSPTGWRVAAVLVAIASTALALASGSRLGRMLTPFPQPILHGRLVTSGVYGLVRHPMYGSVILIAVAAALWLTSLPGLVFAAVLTGFFFAKSTHEEIRLVEAYAGYEAYRREVRRRFIPWLL